MGLTAVEKILARACNRAVVHAGEVVQPAPDFIMVHDGVVRGAKRELDAIGIDRLAAPEKVVMVTKSSTAARAPPRWVRSTAAPPRHGESRTSSM